MSSPTTEAHRTHASWRSPGLRRWAAAAAVFGLMHLDTAPGANAQQKTAAAYSVTVEVSQLRNQRGRLAIGLYDSAAAFPHSKKPRGAALVRANQQPLRVTFSGLKPGSYAVAVLHDENQNNEMDFNFLGMPLEGYGFSNDASGLFGPPSFEAAAIKLQGKSMRAPIKLRYFGL
jgi:uncharacterized protein (DUF2141 family)